MAYLQQINVSEKVLKIMVICYTRELAYQIKHEFERTPSTARTGSPKKKDEKKCLEELKEELEFGKNNVLDQKEMKMS
eukprot:12252399-Heterocapsa_arctica.AAC.1